MSVFGRNVFDNEYASLGSQLAFFSGWARVCMEHQEHMELSFVITSKINQSIRKIYLILFFKIMENNNGKFIGRKYSIR